MDSLSPDHVPVYDTRESGYDLWSRCAEADRPVVAVRDGERGFVVRYDLQHLGVELTSGALRSLRERLLAYRREEPVPDGVSQVERHGGETGPVSGELHESSLEGARTLASHLAETVFDRSNWTPASG
ncbi:hypothetical protein ACFQE8_03910 [Salinirubellus sp. GCM10025818]|uniref:hypothetical protein n=1 Tax=Salinirubellus TaxID=2162630 RepID=UPI0030D56542